jgi:hypothetical protein
MTRIEERSFRLGMGRQELRPGSYTIARSSATLSAITPAFEIRFRSSA